MSNLILYLDPFVLAYALTLLVEIPLLYLVTRKRAKASLILATGIIMNTCTLPVVWFILPGWLEGGAYVLVSEVFAVVIEFVIIRFILSLDSRTAFLGSFLANMGSFLFGILIFGPPV